MINCSKGKVTTGHFTWGRLLVTIEIRYFELYLFDGSTIEVAESNERVQGLLIVMANGASRCLNHLCQRIFVVAFTIYGIHLDSLLITPGHDIHDLKNSSLETFLSKMMKN